MDLIDRQAAIDALIRKTIPVHNSDGSTTVTFMTGRVIRKVLEELSSAQPEIIRCKDCKHYNAGFECLIEGYGIERDEDWYCADAERRTDV